MDKARHALDGNSKFTKIRLSYGLWSILERGRISTPKMCLGHSQTPNIQSSAPEDPFRWTFSQECKALVPGRVNREKQSWNMWLFLQRILTFLCCLQGLAALRSSRLGCWLSLNVVTFGVSNMVWDHRGIWEIPAGFDEEIHLPGWPGVCVHPGHCRMLSLGQLSCKGFWSLLESEPGLLSSVWNPWHEMTWAVQSLLLQQMEWIPGQPLLCKHSQEQLPHQQRCCCHWLTTASQIPWHGQAQSTGNVPVPSTEHRECPCPNHRAQGMSLSPSQPVRLCPKAQRAKSFGVRDKSSPVPDKIWPGPPLLGRWWGKGGFGSSWLFTVLGCAWYSEWWILQSPGVTLMPRGAGTGATQSSGE